MSTTYDHDTLGPSATDAATKQRALVDANLGRRADLPADTSSDVKNKYENDYRWHDGQNKK